MLIKSDTIKYRTYMLARPEDMYNRTRSLLNFIFTAEYHYSARRARLTRAG